MYVCADEAEYAGVVPQLDKEKAAVSDAVEELSESLVAKRKEGMERARQMERDRSLHSLHVLIDRSKRLKQEVKRYKRVLHTAIPPPQPQPNYTEAQETLLQDLEKAISQAQEYRKLTMMKFHMTPRPPAINRRNIADSRMHNGFSLPSDNPLFTPEHQHVPSDNIATSGHHLVTSSEKLNEYLLEVQLPTIAQTIEATSEELNFAAEMQKVTTEQRHNCDSDDTQLPVLEDTLGETEDPELLKLVSAVKNLPKDTRS
eukprot:Em0019g768a